MPRPKKPFEVTAENHEWVHFYLSRLLKQAEPEAWLCPISAVQKMLNAGGKSLRTIDTRCKSLGKLINDYLTAQHQSKLSNAYRQHQARRRHQFVNMKLPETVHEALACFAKSNELSIQEAITQLLAAGLSANHQRQGKLPLNSITTESYESAYWTAADGYLKRLVSVRPETGVFKNEEVILSPSDAVCR